MSEHTKEPWEDRTYIDRFWSRVNVSGNDDCWEWTRGTTRDGYGCFHYGNKSIRTHRFSYQQYNGKIREHECVLHSCDNPRCVNPSHLWLGTRAENNADKEAKKRGVHPVQLSGELNTNTALTTPEVMAARVMARKGLPQARIAKLLGVSTSTVCMIVSGERREEETEQRVSACVNACAGIDTPSLEATNKHGVTLRQKLAGAQEQMETLEQQRDELYTSANAMAETINAIAALVTYRHESKEAFIGRVRSVLGDDPDLRVSSIRKQRDELLAALERIERGADSGWVVDIAKAAIAGVKGGV